MTIKEINNIIKAKQKAQAEAEGLTFEEYKQREKDEIKARAYQKELKELEAQLEYLQEQIAYRKEWLEKRG